MDTGAQLAAAIARARESGGSLVIGGLGSKSSISPAVSGDLLVTTEISGIVHYDPAELVITAQAGTPLRDLRLALHQHDQTLLCDPPRFRGSGTVGGAVAAGLSGPGRPWHGAVRDAVLGVRLLNGRAETLTFGGQVMKNVAGYDVSRLVTGAWGALGVILEVSLRVAPQWQTQQTVGFSMAAPEAVRFCRDMARSYLPVSGTWWADDRLYVRLSGTSAAVHAAADELGGENNLHSDSWLELWNEVRDHAHAFFKPRWEQPESPNIKLWRIVVPASAPVPQAGPGRLALEWGGGLRWWWHDDADGVHSYAREHRGWAWALGEPIALDAAQRKLMSNIKAAFDPDGVLHSPLHLTGGSDED